jgi:glycosyltransferase involved in cell wall biosynthesis
MLLTVFTPSHNPRWLTECAESLRAQTYQHFEWIVCPNGGARWDGPSPPVGDAGVRIRRCDELRGVGAAKAFACRFARGDVLVELDHDDLLAETALERIAETFVDHPEAALVYSDSAQVLEDGSRDESRWVEANGWRYGDQRVAAAGRKFSVLGVEALEPTPHNLSYIWWAPNHVRAFRREAYEDAGGYDPDRDVLDDQDLMCRLYEQGEFVRIPECLYLQRAHKGMTQVQQELNDRIQEETVELYERYLERNALAWARRRGLLALDLGGASAIPEVPSTPPGYTCVDRRPSPGYVGDVFDCFDLIERERGRRSVGVMRAVDFLEHVSDKVRLINRIHEMLAPDGLLLSITPSTDGRGAWQDPTHVAGYNEHSFWYYVDAQYQAYVPELTARFQASRLRTFFPSSWHEEVNIPYVEANLIALHPGGQRNGGVLGWDT